MAVGIFFLTLNLFSCKSVSKVKEIQKPLDYTDKDVIENEIKTIRELQQNESTKALFRACLLNNSDIINECAVIVKNQAEKAIEEVDPKTIDLHKPYVDDIHIKCPKCGKEMTRTSEVIDCWFDSGSMPFAQYHYPFENKELWEEQFPADFIAEGIDQTRG